MCLVTKSRKSAGNQKTLHSSLKKTLNEEKLSSKNHGSLQSVPSFPKIGGRRIEKSKWSCKATGRFFPPNIVSKITTFCERSKLERTGSGSYGRDRGGGG